MLEQRENYIPGQFERVSLTEFPNIIKETKCAIVSFGFEILDVRLSSNNCAYNVLFKPIDRDGNWIEKPALFVFRVITTPFGIERYIDHQKRIILYKSFMLGSAEYPDQPKLLMVIDCQS